MESMLVYKDLKVKGALIALKRGKVIEKIKLANNKGEVICRVDGSNIVLRTEFLKKG